MSTRNVTGDALNIILQANKEYIDRHDIVFEDATLDKPVDIPDTPNENVYIDDSQVQNIINKYFTSN